MLAEQKLAADPGDRRAHRGDPGRAEELAPVYAVRHGVLLRVPPRPGRCGPWATRGAAPRNSHSPPAPPATPPIPTGMTSATWLAGLVTTTNAANRVNAATPATQAAASRRASVPTTTATTAKVRYMPSSSTVRPCAPKWCTTALRSAAGVRSANTAAI